MGSKNWQETNNKIQELTKASKNKESDEWFSVVNTYYK